MTRFLALLLLALASCGPAKQDPPPDFSEDFLWGSAIAGFQADMGCPTLPSAECEDRNSDWYQFITAPETKSLSFMSGDAPTTGPGFWELYEQDLDRAKNDLQLNGFRLSIEWSRLFPTATDGIEGHAALKAVADPKALAKYHAMFQGASARGLKPLVTLNHYSLPIWIHDAVECHKSLSTCTKRGWLDKDRILREIAKYSAFCAQEFGGEVDQWVTQNEPLAVVLPGYVQPGTERANPPGVLAQFSSARQVMMNMIEGHARMYDALKASDTQDADGDGQNSFIGLVYAMVPIKGKTDNRADQRAAQNVFYLYNTVFLDGAIKGDLDLNLDRNITHRDDLAGRMDFVGINYYTRTTVVGTNEVWFPELSPLTTFDPLKVEVWEDYPLGLYEMAMHVKERYGLPTIITENGSAATDNTTGVAGAGTSASSYLARHVQALKKARHDGADVRGYFYWTFMDNYEWNHGMNIRMGLYAVDKNDPTKARTMRPAAEVYRKIVEANDVPADVASEFPLP